MLKKLIALAGVALALYTTGQTPSALQRPLPETWGRFIGISQTLPSEDNWWRNFDDPLLDSLISAGIDANYDVAMAAARMDAASRQIAVAKAGYYPTVGAEAAYTRSRSQGVDANDYALRATVNWEIDVFGRIGAQVKEKKAAYRASHAEWVASMVSLASEIASTYVQLRVWQAELDVAIAQTATQDSISKLVESRYEAGLGARPAVDQSMSLLYSTRATIPGLRSSVQTAISSLSLLLGTYPDELYPVLSVHRGLPNYRCDLQPGVPADLLRRRPDIAEAEANLAEAAAAVGIAKKDFLPTLALTGSVGVEAPRVGDMFTSRGFGYTVAPTLSWTIFDGMARQATVAAARDEMEAQIASYNNTVISAYNEVHNALYSYMSYMQQLDDYEAARHSASEFLRLEVDLYTQGLTTYSDVATAQQSLLSYSNSLIVAKGNAASALVALYKALGGGFDIE